jgi:hypothetical protein
VKTLPRPTDKDIVATLASIVQNALDSWPKTLRLCLLLASIALVLAVLHN